MPYCTVADLRAEGVTEAQASDERLAALIAEATALIDRLTGWFFEPRALVLRLDGRGTPTLEPPYPPISLNDLRVGFGVIRVGDLDIVGAPVMPGFVAPRITRRHGVFPRGPATVVAIGMWGYTEPDGTPMGRTPLAIRRACMMLVMRTLPPLGDTDAVDDMRNRSRILELRTREQMVKFSAPIDGGDTSLGCEVDDLLSLYRRPMGLGAA